MIDKHKMRKHFDLTITDTSFAFARKTDAIEAEAATDGIYIVRTSLGLEVMDDAATVRSYKSLPGWSAPSAASRPSISRSARCVTGWKAGSGLTSSCACWPTISNGTVPGALAALFDDTDKEAAEAERNSPVAKAQRSPAAIRKQTTGLTPDGLPVHSFHTLLADLATLARNTVVVAITPDLPLCVMTRPTPVQRRAFELPSTSHRSQ